MENFKSFIEKFYNENKIFLSANYPGLSVNRLIQELSEYSLLGHKDELEFLTSPFLEGEKAPISQFFQSLLNGIPIEYIVKHCHFYKSKFFINQDVLIPRNETEQMVEMALVDLENLKKDKKQLKIMDIGTGSGVILLTLLKESKFPIEGIGTDISQAALEVAKKNHFYHEYLFSKNTNCSFILTDRLDGVFERSDMIISNPPYIMRESDKDLVHHQTLSFEPDKALFLDDDTYFLWFEELFNSVAKNLYEGGVFWMEGHENHLKKLQKMAQKLPFTVVEIKKDYQGVDRFLRATKG